MSAKDIASPDIDPYRGEKEGTLREIGGQAVWSLSSCKQGIYLSCNIYCIVKGLGKEIEQMLF